MGSASLHLVGFKPPDETWEKMRQVWNACIDAKVPVPRDVEKFFGGEHPDPAGVEVRLGHHYGYDAKTDHPCVTVLEGTSMGLEIDVGKLPSDIKIIRVSLSF